MKKLLLLISATLLTLASISSAFAIDPTITPTRDAGMMTPTQRAADANGVFAPLGLSEIASINMYCGSATGVYDVANPIVQTTVLLPETTITVDLTSYPDGNIFCAAKTVDIDGRKSVYSNEISLPIAHLGKPKAGVLRWK